MAIPPNRPKAAPDEHLLYLPDYLVPGLELVFVGINPGLLSAQQGYYFARRSNRFWPAFSRSRLSAPVRAALERDALGPDDDARLLEFGIGFTDVVAFATRNAACLRSDDFRAGAPDLLARLQRCRPRVACFHGLTAYRAFARFALGRNKPVNLGPQPQHLGETRLFVTPSPSGANAHVRPADYIVWYDRLADFLQMP